MSDKNVKKLPRQYHLRVNILKDLDSYVLDHNKKNKSEVVEMAIKEFLKKCSMKLLVLAAVTMLLSQSSWAALTNIGSTSEIIDKILNLLSAIGVVVGSGGIGYALLMGAWLWIKNKHAEAIEHMTGGAIGAFIGFAVAGLARWVVSFF